MFLEVESGGAAFQLCKISVNMDLPLVWNEEAFESGDQGVVAESKDQVRR
jgi:hypothetical protein